MHSRRQIADDLRALGVAPRDVIMAHASVRSIGEVAGGPDEIHLAIEDVLTDEGTLMMYVGCPQYADEVGRGNLTAAQEAELLDKLPPFDANTARSDRSIGTLAEFFRSYPGTRVNQHVTRFAIRGQQAEFLLAEQPWSYAYGHGSALERFVGLDGRILLLGSDHDTVTFLHYAEHVVDIPGKRVARFQVPVLEDGARVWREMEEFNSGTDGLHDHWPDRFFALLTDSYITASRNPGGRVGEAWCYLLNARELLEFSLPIMRALGSDARAADALRELPVELQGRREA